MVEVSHCFSATFLRFMSNALSPSPTPHTKRVQAWRILDSALPNSAPHGSNPRYDRYGRDIVARVQLCSVVDVAA